jgi:hypothetical protein
MILSVHSDADIGRRALRGGEGTHAARDGRQTIGARDLAVPGGGERGSGASALRERQADLEKIVIELSPAQVDRVIRGAADGGNISVLLSGLKDVREVLAREPRQLDDSRLSRSLLAGLLMLASFPTDGSYLGNAEIARMLDMNPSTTHRYVSTLVAVGLLERDPSTRRYRLV